MSTSTIADPIKVNIDIAGFFFEKTVIMPRGSTLQQAMTAIEAMGTTQLDNGTRGKLLFTPANGFVSNITIEFETTPLPRQTNTSLPNLRPGRYGLTDGFAVQSSQGPEDLIGVAGLNWQFYVHAATFEGDKVVSKGEALNVRTQEDGMLKRKIDPFSGFSLMQDVAVVWRAIVIMDSPADFKGPTTDELRA